MEREFYKNCTDNHRIVKTFYSLKLLQNIFGLYYHHPEKEEPLQRINTRGCKSSVLQSVIQVVIAKEEGENLLPAITSLSNTCDLITLWFTLTPSISNFYKQPPNPLTS